MNYANCLTVQMYKNRYDRRGAGELGSQGETLFKEIAERKGFTVEKSSLQSDIHEHIDYILTKDDKIITFDVKSEKSDDKIYVEFMNVQGNSGWIHGKQHCIAFVFSGEIVIVKRKTLLEFIKSKMDVNEKPMKTSIESYFRVYEEEAFYKMFRRYGRQDAVVLIPVSDLIDMEHITWTK